MRKFKGRDTLVLKTSFFALCVTATLVFALVLDLMPSTQAHAQQIFGVPNNKELNVNSFFCKCDDSENDHILVRVDISQGKKFETKVRAFPKKSFTLPQCEAFINTYSSCLK